MAFNLLFPIAAAQTIPAFSMVIGTSRVYGVIPCMQATKDAKLDQKTRTQMYEHITRECLQQREKDEGPLYDIIVWLREQDVTCFEDMDKKLRKAAVKIHDKEQQRIRARASREGKVKKVWESSMHGRLLLAQLGKEKFSRTGTKAWISARNLSFAYDADDVVNGLDRTIFKRVTRASIERNKRKRNLNLGTSLLDIDWTTLNKIRRVKGIPESDRSPLSPDLLQAFGFILGQDGFVKIDRGRKRPTNPTARRIYDMTLAFEEERASVRRPSQSPAPRHSMDVSPDSIKNQSSLGKRRANSVPAEMRVREDEAAKRQRLDQQESNRSGTQQNNQASNGVEQEETNRLDTEQNNQSSNDVEQLTSATKSRLQEVAQLMNKRRERELQAAKAAGVNQEGAAEDEEEAAEDQEGAAEDQEGAAEDQERAAEDQEGAAEDQEGAAEDQEGAAEDQEGAAGDQEGAAGDQEGAAGDQEGAAGNQASLESQIGVAGNVVLTATRAAEIRPQLDHAKNLVREAYRTLESVCFSKDIPLPTKLWRHCIFELLWEEERVLPVRLLSRPPEQSGQGSS